jgi:hypothetical protein
MPGSFDEELMIDEHGCISPAGPLKLKDGETVLRLDVWVFQRRDDGTGGACVAFKPGPFKGERWTTNPDPHDDHFGEGFQPGTATGMGLMVSDKGGQKFVFQWGENITLKK